MPIPRRFADPLVALMLAVLVIVAMLAYYRIAYHPAVLADDQIRGLFEGFHSPEGVETGVFRWTKGHGRLCLPAAGQWRPALELRLALPGREPQVDVRTFTLAVGTLRWYLPLGDDGRLYRLLVPPDAGAGPVCAELISATVSPPGDGRALGVAFHALTLRLVGTPALPPLERLTLYTGATLAGYWLLRRLGLPLIGAVVAVAVPGLALSAGLLSGQLRAAPDLPLWGGYAATAVVALLAADILARDRIARLERPWLRELAGVAIVALLLWGAWVVVNALDGYGWPFPLMARPGLLGGAQLWGGLLPVALCGAWLLLLSRWLAPGKLPPAWLVIATCWLVACLLAVTLKISLRGWDTLFQTFALQPDDYINDVPRIGNDPLGFLRGYVDLMPELARHNRNHPPGSTLLLWVVARLFGSGPQPATWVTIALAGLGVWPAYRMAARAGGAEAGLLAAAIYGMLPAQLIYTATSMNAVYATILAFALDALHATFAGGARPWRALAAGLWLGLGLCFFFGTLMLALFVPALLWWRHRRGETAIGLFNAAVAAGALLALLGLLYAVSGYSTIAALLQGVANNYDEVQQRLPPPGPARYLFFLIANGLAYALFLGPWLVARIVGAGCAGVAALLHRDQQPTGTDAVVGGLLCLLTGMLISGLFTREVERIWSFTHILVAFVAAHSIIHTRPLLGLSPQTVPILGTLFLQALLFRATMGFYW